MSRTPFLTRVSALSRWCLDCAIIWRSKKVAKEGSSFSFAFSGHHLLPDSNICDSWAFRPSGLFLLQKLEVWQGDILHFRLLACLLTVLAFWLHCNMDFGTWEWDSTMAFFLNGSIISHGSSLLLLLLLLPGHVLLRCVVRIVMWWGCEWREET